MHRFRWPKTIGRLIHFAIDQHIRPPEVVSNSHRKSSNGRRVHLMHKGFGHAVCAHYNTPLIAKPYDTLTHTNKTPYSK